MLHIGDSKYYTPLELSSFLITLLPQGDYTSAIDICCGSWNLLNAVKDRWPKVDIIGVDLDENAKHIAPHGSKFYLGDGRLFSSDYCINSKKLFDLVVANPPFGRFKGVSFHKIFQGIAKNRMETDMILSNANLVKQGGWLLAIVPSSFVESESFKEVRKFLLKWFCLEKLIKLPNKIFGNKEVKSYAILLHKTNISSGKSICETHLFEATCCKNEWTKELKYILPISLVMQGQWIHTPDRLVTKTQFENIKMFRGSISSNNFTSKGFPVFHNGSTSAGREAWEPTTRFIDNTTALDFKCTAQMGDIIISRIGRTAGKWCMYSGEKTLISDCLLVLRADPRNELINLLKNNSINGCLKEFIKGIAAQYVSQKDIFSWIDNNYDVG